MHSYYEAYYQAGGTPLPTFQGTVSFSSDETCPDEIEKDAIARIQRRVGRIPVRVLEISKVVP